VIEDAATAGGADGASGRPIVAMATTPVTNLLATPHLLTRQEQATLPPCVKF
jgi:hypothetical protein